MAAVQNTYLTKAQAGVHAVISMLAAWLVPCRTQAHTQLHMTSNEVCAIHSWCAAGGAVEYAKDGINAFLINTTDPVHAINKLADIVNGKHDLAAMRKAALKTAPRFSMETSSAATASIFRAFQKQWQAARALKLGMRRSLAFTPKETSHQQVMTTPSPVKAPADNSEHVGRKETKVVDKAPVAAVAVKRHF